MKIIGICGGSGSGKTEALRILAADGMPTLNCDAVSRQVMQPGSVCCRELCEAFGTELLREDGSLDRRRLFALTFNDPEKLQTLNRITHFHILRQVDAWLEAHRSSPAVAVEAPLLFESGLDKRCDAIVLITADRAGKLARLAERDGLSADDASLRLSRQLDDAYLAARCDRVVENNGVSKRKTTVFVLLLAVVLLAAFAAFKLYRDRRASFPLTYREQVEALSAEYGVPVPLIFAVVKAESGFRPEAQSHAGACGLMQLMPATYREIAGRLGEDCDESLIFDPTQNLRYGVYYLSYLYRYFGDYYTALAAYNAGIGRVSGWVADSRYSSDGVTLHSIPIAETETYVRRIRDYEQTYTEILEKEG